MVKEQNFIDDILSSPDEALPKLVYADWLEENADVRADIVRALTEDGLSCFGEPEFNIQVEIRSGKCSNIIKNSGLTIEQFIQYAADTAESVLHVFEENYPEDDRPRKAIEAIRSKDVATAVCNARSTADAVWDARHGSGAAWAAWASRDAAAACYTADAACDAADASPFFNNSREKQWRYNLLRLAEYKYFNSHKIWTKHGIYIPSKT